VTFEEGSSDEVRIQERSIVSYIENELDLAAWR
jgi:hypothetical protein